MDPYFYPSTIRRILAHAIDGVMRFFFFLPVMVQLIWNWLDEGILHVEISFLVACTVGYIAYQTVAYRWFAGTLGKWLMGLRLVPINRHREDLGWRQSLIRVAADQFSFFFGWSLWALALIRIDRRHASDWLAETRVVQVADRQRLPRRHFFIALLLFFVLGVSSWSSVQHNWRHVEIRDKEIYFN